jgi:hypothetical protein
MDVVSFLEASSSSLRGSDPVEPMGSWERKPLLVSLVTHIFFLEDVATVSIVWSSYILDCPMGSK